MIATIFPCRKKLGMILLLVVKLVVIYDWVHDLAIASNSEVVDQGFLSDPLYTKYHKCKKIV